MTDTQEQLNGLQKRVESLESWIEVLKAVTGPPVRFSSWEQFDKVVTDAYENQ